MRESLLRSMSRLANRVFSVLPIVIVLGCGSGNGDPPAGVAKPLGPGSNGRGSNGRAVAVDPPKSDGRKTAGQANDSVGPAKVPSFLDVRLGNIPKLKPAHSTKATPQEAEEIKQLIRSLAALDSPDFGLSGTMSGDNFLPIDGAEQPGAMILMDHQLKSSPELRKLVELGPKSLPFLLDALDDQTPTRLVITHGGGMGIMEFTNELHGNPVNRVERKVLGTGRPSLGFSGKHVDSYTVKVGDVCLVAIGQIVGRSYEAVRYQPTACIMLNSPTHDAKLCRQVRDIWTSEDAGQTLFDSLLLDYSTEGVFNGKTLDGWSLASHLQIGAAMRLLYYFPAESAGLIADRLDALDLRATWHRNGSPAPADELDSYEKRCVANGVGAEDFVKAVAWCGEPRIKAAMLRAFERATDPDVVVASMRSVGPDIPAKGIDRVASIIDGLTEDDDGGPFGDGYNLLVALGRYGGVETKSIFQKYLKTRTIQHCRSACHALREARGEWSAELLAPLLEDRRKAGGWTYAVDPMKDGPRLPIRVCDEAAQTIAEANPGLHFEMRGTHADLDRQIRAIQAALSGPRA